VERYVVISADQLHISSIFPDGVTIFLRSFGYAEIVSNDLPCIRDSPSHAVAIDRGVAPVMIREVGFVGEIPAAERFANLPSLEFAKTPIGRPFRMCEPTAREDHERQRADTCPHPALFKRAPSSSRK
jgi:hypothetical protein